MPAMEEEEPHVASARTSSSPAADSGEGQGKDADVPHILLTIPSRANNEVTARKRERDMSNDMSSGHTWRKQRE